MEYLSLDFLRLWATNNCHSKEELEYELSKANEESDKMLSKLDGIEITVNPIVFDSNDFSTVLAFNIALFEAARRYKDTNDILVRYTKPKDKETKEQHIQFHILKSKAKVFKNYMLSSDDSFAFSLESASEIKDCVKFFNSLGVKGEDGESITSDGNDCSKDMRDAFKKCDNKVFVNIYMVFDEEGNYVALEWYLVGADKECCKYEDIKNKVKEIIGG